MSILYLQYNTSLTICFEPIIKNEIFIHAILLDPRFKDLQERKDGKP